MEERGRQLVDSEGGKRLGESFLDTKRRYAYREKESAIRDAPRQEGCGKGRRGYVLSA